MCSIKISPNYDFVDCFRVLKQRIPSFWKSQNNEFHWSEFSSLAPLALVIYSPLNWLRSSYETTLRARMRFARYLVPQASAEDHTRVPSDRVCLVEGSTRNNKSSNTPLKAWRGLVRMVFPIVNFALVSARWRFSEIKSLNFCNNARQAKTSRSSTDLRLPIVFQVSL